MIAISHKGFSDCEFYEGVPGFKPVIADLIKIKQGARTRHIFFDTRRDQLISFMESHGVPNVPIEYDAGTNRRLGVPAAFYHAAFEAGSEAALADKPDDLRSKGVEVADVVDHALTKSIYFKDPNGVSLEYCCFVRNFTKDDATIQERFTLLLAALELCSAASSEITKAQSVR
jgi:hypothetical protein